MLFTLRILLFLSFFSLLCRLLFGLIGLTQQDDGLMTAMVWCVSGWLTFWHGPLYQALVEQLARVGGSSWLPAEGRLILPFINNGGSEVDLSALLGLSTCCMAAAVVNMLATATEVIEHAWRYCRPWVLQRRFKKRRHVNRVLHRSLTLTNQALNTLPTYQPVKASPVPADGGINSLLSPLATPANHSATRSPLPTDSASPFNQTLYPWQYGRSSALWGLPNQHGDASVNSAYHLRSGLGSVPKIVSPRASIMLPRQDERPSRLWLPIDGPPTQAP
jgi:hypothetical protein